MGWKQNIWETCPQNLMKGKIYASTMKQHTLYNNARNLFETDIWCEQCINQIRQYTGFVSLVSGDCFERNLTAILQAVAAPYFKIMIFKNDY